MTIESTPKNALLLQFQRIIWYVYVGYLCIACLLLVTRTELGVKLSYWGVIFVLIATVGQLFFMANDFKRSGSRHFMLLSYALILVILVSTALGAWII